MVLNNKIELPGIALPFYREYGTEAPNGEQLVEGQNYGEHQLFALKTRLEADREYADLCTQLGTNITFTKVASEGGMVSYLCINYLKEGKIETIVPEWLSKKVNFWLKNYQDYFVILSDRYPTGLEKTLPTWWLRDVLSKINLTNLLKESFYSDDIEPDVINGRDVSSYDYFYSDGVLFLRMINPETAKLKDLGKLKSGQTAFKRVQDTFGTHQDYGDYGDYSERYSQLQLSLLETLEKWYTSGTLVLGQSESEVIQNWNLVQIEGQDGIYQASWDDSRFTFYDGITPMLYRQLPSYSNSWDYRLLYFYMGINPAAVHDILKIVSDYSPQSSLTVQGDVLVLNIDNYNDAVSYADMISEIKSTSHGIVIKNVQKQSGSVMYYDAIDKRNIYISRVPDEMKFLVYSPRPAVGISNKPTITLPDLSFLNNFSGGFPMQTGIGAQNIQSPMYSLGSPLPTMGYINT